jgi:uncharacterized MAPEG superfamily protein
MTFALWCVLVAAFLPVATVGIAKARGRGFDNSDPRLWLESQEGLVRRADHAHRNHFEAFPLFGLAVIFATLRGMDADRLNLLCGAFIALRIVYTGLYLGNLPTLRSTAWFLAIICSVTIFFLAAQTHPV